MADVCVGQQALRLSSFRARGTLKEGQFQVGGMRGRCCLFKVGAEEWRRLIFYSLSFRASEAVEANAV